MMSLLVSTQRRTMRLEKRPNSLARTAAGTV